MINRFSMWAVCRNQIKNNLCLKIGNYLVFILRLFYMAKVSRASFCDWISYIPQLFSDAMKKAPQKRGSKLSESHIMVIGFAVCSDFR